MRAAAVPPRPSLSSDLDRFGGRARAVLDGRVALDRKGEELGRRARLLEGLAVDTRSEQREVEPKHVGRPEPELGCASEAVPSPVG